ncbi:MAG: hypothetical protein KDD25_00610 [Bdellovibrionales bacterium]|nr:hypothetical protein [Bdellovibrionales bacterium]
MRIKFLKKIKMLKLEIVTLLNLKNKISTHGSVETRGVGWSLQAKDWLRFLSREQVQMVSVSQGMAVPMLRSVVQDARGSGSSPLFSFYSNYEKRWKR